MTEINPTPAALRARYRRIHAERMQGLPIVNAALDVATAGFRPFESHALGVLVTPWFMNLVVLPGDDTWADEAQGAVVSIDLPAGTQEMTVHRDEELGLYLSVVLYRDVTPLASTDEAVELGANIVERLFEPPAADAPPARLSRRALFAGAGTD